MPDPCSTCGRDGETLPAHKIGRYILDSHPSVSLRPPPSAETVHPSDAPPPAPNRRPHRVYDPADPRFSMEVNDIRLDHVSLDSEPQPGLPPLYTDPPLRPGFSDAEINAVHDLMTEMRCDYREPEVLVVAPERNVQIECLWGLPIQINDFLAPNGWAIFGDGECYLPPGITVRRIGPDGPLSGE